MPVSSRCRNRAHAPRALFEHLESRLLLSSSPTGAVDVFSRTQISGWAYNADDKAAALEIDITLNGVKSTLLANQNRLDLAARLGSPYHGFSFTLPQLPAGNSTVLIQAVSLSSGAVRTLRSGTLTNPVPAGSVKFTTTDISGWMYDPDAGGPVTLRLDIDGTAGTPFSANLTRSDISTSHRYNTSLLGFDLPGNYAGHVVELYAYDAPTGTPRLMYTNNKKPIGKVEVNDGYTVSGWALDPDNPAAAISIRVDIDGVTLSGTPTTASLSRPDLVAKYGSAGHGFSVTIPGLTPGAHTIAVYAIDGQANSQTPILIGSKVVTDRPPTGKIEVASSSIISGWALDPDLGTAAATVNIYVDQQSFVTIPANLARKDSKNGHGFSVDLSSLSSSSHAITVTVTDNRISNNREVVLYDNFINNHPPTGSFDSATGNIITGWAFDADAPNQADAVDLYVDGKYVETFSADQARADVDALLPTPNHAFSKTLPALSFGKHRLDLYAAESQGNASVLIGTKFVTNNRPAGVLESSSAAAIIGWAADYDLPGQSVDLQVYINGVLAISTTTDVSRPDIAAFKALATVPSFTSYGFSISLPTLSSGRNQIDVFAVDANNGLLTPLGSAVILV